MKKIAPDKWKHFVVGVLLGLLLFGLFQFFLPFHQTTNIVLSLGAVITISYIFELFSLITGNGHYEMMDAIASIVGGLAGVGLAIGLNWLRASAVL